MASPGWSLNTTYNYYDQPFTLTLPDGQTPFAATLSDVFALNQLIASQAIIYGTQLGLTSLLFLIMVLLTKKDKRSSWVFIMNVSALLLIFVRNILSCVQLKSIFYNFYNWELHYYPESAALSRAMNISATTEILNLVVNAIIYTSLVLQVHIVCCTVTTALKNGLVILSAVVAVVATGIRFALAVLNIKWNIFGLNTLQEYQFDTLNKVASINNIVSVTAIALFTLIFIAKLAVAIHVRRKMNMKQFGPMQIIFVMGCQTMIVPLIFTVVNSYSQKGSQLNSMVPTIVAIFLPLSGMWASAQTNNERLARAESRFHRAIPVGVSDLSSKKTYGSTKTMDTTDTLVDDDDTYGASSSGRKTTSANGKGMEVVDMCELDDMEAQRLRGAVVVDRTYSVRSD